MHPALVLTVAWRPNDDPQHPWRADVEGVVWQVRINDDSPEYTLLVGGRATVDFDDWPDNWYRPLPNRSI